MNHRIILYSVALIIIFGLLPYTVDNTLLLSGEHPSVPQPKKLAGKDVSPQERVNDLHTTAGTFEPGETFVDVLKDAGFTNKEILKLNKNIRDTFDLANVKSGNEYKLSFDKDGNLRRIFYEINDENFLSVDIAEEADVSASVEKFQFDRKLKYLEGKITNSLFETISPEGKKDRLALKLTEIFAWSVDFYYDLRAGDTLKILYEEKYKEGKYVKTGRILFARLDLSGDVYPAYLFKSRGEWGYFNEKGKSLKKQFLKSPVKYGRVTSGFTYNRYHPIFKENRPHLGVDYAAPRGTPIRATADGIVSEVSYNKPSGRYIKIKHGSIYSTSYCHMSSYARGMRRGKHVKQGQTVGYVGSTGYSTGPHVDYRLRKRGKSIDPRTFKSPAAEPLEKKEKEKFRILIDFLNRQIEQNAYSLNEKLLKKAYGRIKKNGSLAFLNDRIKDG